MGQRKASGLNVRHVISVSIPAFFIVVAMVVAAIWGLQIRSVWGDELRTLDSIRLVRFRDDAHLDGAVYTMHVKGDFYLDDFIARGGAKSDAELISFLVDNITKGVIPIDIDTPRIGCASFTATTESGDKLFGRNYDFAKTNTCIVFTEANEGRHASISTVDLQFLGIDVNSNLSGLTDRIVCLAAPYLPLDGINDVGVSCGIYMTYQGPGAVPTNQQTDKPDLTSTTLLRLILDYADNVDEAVEIARAYDLHDSAGTSYHYMVADASGRSAILEWVSGTDSTDTNGAARELVVYYNDADSSLGEWEASSDFQWVTNFIVAPGYYDGSPSYQKKGFDRYEAIYNELNATGGIVADEEDAMQILKLIGRRSWKNDDGNGCTVHSVIYNLTDRSMLWVSNENFDKNSATFEFSLR